MAESQDPSAHLEPGELEQETIQSISPAVNHASDTESDIKSPAAKSEAPSEAEAATKLKEDTLQYRWCKCYFEAAPGTQNFYYMHFDTRATQNDEPKEPYWIWDAALQNVDPSGLQMPSKPAQSSSEPDPEYQGYNPKIHGNYDPNAPYAKYHQRKWAQENATSGTLSSDPSLAPGIGPGFTGTFNRFTGSFQTSEKSTERYNDFNKSGRQLNAFFDVDAAANAHEGRSLKEERRLEKKSKKEIQELAEKRRKKKEKKRLDFYRS